MSDSKSAPPHEAVPADSASPPSWLLRCRELALYFLWLGATAFGGPAVHTAVLRDEFVVRRKWLGDREFLDLVAAAQLIPGPNSTELAMFLGARRAGFAGLWVAGICFIAPGALATLLLTEVYLSTGAVPEFQNFMAGLQPAMVAVIAHAVVPLAQASLVHFSSILIFVAAIAASAAGWPEWVVLIICGIISGALFVSREERIPPAGAPPAIALPGLLYIFKPLVSGSALVTAGALGPWSIFTIFLKIGSLIFGGGYVLLSYLRSEFVTGRGVLTSEQLLDAVAIGQLTPGPLFTTATCVGHLTAGPAGAAAATFGIFLPAFIVVSFASPLLAVFQRYGRIRAFMEGVGTASVALMAIVGFQLAASTLVAPLPVAIAMGVLALLLKFRLNSVLALLLGGFGSAGARLFFNG